MAELVNLRLARKARARAEADAAASANRAAFGRTKAEKVTIIAEAARNERLLNGAKRMDEPSKCGPAKIPKLR